MERPATVATDEIIQPQEGRGARLQAAVTFSPSELTAILAPKGVGIEALAALTIDAGSSTVTDVDVDNLPTYQQPILKLGGYHVLVAPSSLPGALCHALLSMASEYGALAAVAERWRITSFERVNDSLELLGCARLLGPLASTDPTLPAVAAAYQFDSDKILNLILLNDPLDGFDTTTVGGDWSLGDLSERIATELRSRERGLAMSPAAPNELLSLVAFATPGRSFGLWLSDSRYGHYLMLSAEDLEVIAHTSSQRLTLWQYAKASDRLRDFARVLAFDPLDEFAFWKSNGFTYYLSDQQPPTAVMIAPGTALDLRIEARDLLDRHTLPAPSGHGRVEVMRYQSRDVPIYMAVPGDVEVLALAVDGLPLTLWIEAGRSVVEQRFVDLIHQLVDLVAYWIWQFTPHLSVVLQRLASTFEPLVIEVDLIETEAWFAEAPPSQQILEVSLDDRGVRLTFLEGAATLFDGADNDGERRLLRVFLDTLHEMSWDAVGTAARPSEDSVAQAIETHAPLGPKKKLTILSGNMSVLLDQNELPPYRPLQAAVTEEWRDSEHELLTRLGLKRGPIRSEERVSTLKRMVAEAFASFERQVAALNPAGLLETLVARGERLIQKEEHDRRMIPTKIACYGSIPEMVDELAREGPLLSTTSIAHRFVIEYVVARPPQGLRPMSLEAYDQLIAQAALLMSWGLQCDAIHYGLADPELSVLESGRLGSLALDYDAATADYGERAYTEQIARSAASFSAMFESAAQPDGDALISEFELEAASRQELGLGFARIAEFIEALDQIGLSQPGPTKRIMVGELRERLLSDQDWSSFEIDTAFALLSLAPRDKFLDPPQGLDRRDVFPWVFSRRLSYLGRPLLVRNGSDASKEVFWGQRSLLRSHEYLLRQFVDGRWRARSDLMRKLQGRITKHSGEAFNDRVAEAFEEVDGAVVRRRVRSIAGRRIERRRGQPLGDVDVLVALIQSREVLLVETKSFKGARTPAEFGNEAGKLGDALKIHAERSAWVGVRLPELLAWLEIDDTRVEAWRVRQVVVVSGEVFTTGMRELPIPVVTLASLREWLDEEGTGQK